MSFDAPGMVYTLRDRMCLSGRHDNLNVRDGTWASIWPWFRKLSQRHTVEWPLPRLVSPLDAAKEVALH